MERTKEWSQRLHEGVLYFVSINRMEWGLLPYIFLSVRVSVHSSQDYVLSIELLALLWSAVHIFILLYHHHQCILSPFFMEWWFQGHEWKNKLIQMWVRVPHAKFSAPINFPAIQPFLGLSCPLVHSSISFGTSGPFCHFSFISLVDTVSSILPMCCI